MRLAGSNWLWLCLCLCLCNCHCLCLCHLGEKVIFDIFAPSALSLSLSLHCHGRPKKRECESWLAVIGAFLQHALLYQAQMLQPFPWPFTYLHTGLHGLQGIHGFKPEFSQGICEKFNTVSVLDVPLKAISQNLYIYDIQINSNITQSFPTSRSWLHFVNESALSWCCSISH